jgi:hypothetical protein
VPAAQRFLRSDLRLRRGLWDSGTPLGGLLGSEAALRPVGDEQNIGHHRTLDQLIARKREFQARAFSAHLAVFPNENPRCTGMVHARPDQQRKLMRLVESRFADSDIVGVQSQFFPRVAAEKSYRQQPAARRVFGDRLIKALKICCRQLIKRAAGVVASNQLIVRHGYYCGIPFRRRAKQNTANFRA